MLVNYLFIFKSEHWWKTFLFRKVNRILEFVQTPKHSCLQEQEMDRHGLLKIMEE